MTEPASHLEIPTAGRIPVPIRDPVEDLDALRGMAILMVFTGNIPFNLFAWRSSLGTFEDGYWSGSAGLDLFLAVTGFTTARAMKRPRAHAGAAGARPPVVDFFIRRFWRRTPLAWTWIAIPLALSLVLRGSGAFHPPPVNFASGIAALLGVDNIWLARAFDTGEPGILFPYWTLSLGTQLALLLAGLHAACGRRLPWALGLLLAYSFVMPQQALCFYTRPGAFALGALLAIGSVHREYCLAAPRFLRHAGWRGACLAVALLLLGAVQSSLLRPLVSIPLGLSALVAGALVYAASFDAGYVAGTGLARRAWAALGRRSYAIYLTHITAFALTRAAYAYFRPSLGDPSARQAEHMAIVALVLTALASEVSYRLVERPGQRRAQAFAAPPVSPA